MTTVEVVLAFRLGEELGERLASRLRTSCDRPGDSPETARAIATAPLGVASANKACDCAWPGVKPHLRSPLPSRPGAIRSRKTPASRASHSSRC